MNVSIETAMEKFRRAAVTKGDGLGGRADEREYEHMAHAYHDLVESGSDGRAALMVLLADPSTAARTRLDRCRALA
jgi:hypothetical protein